MSIPLDSNLCAVVLLRLWESLSEIALHVSYFWTHIEHAHTFRHIVWSKPDSCLVFLIAVTSDSHPTLLELAFLKL